MIDRSHALLVTRQAQQLGISDRSPSSTCPQRGRVMAWFHPPFPSARSVNLCHRGPQQRTRRQDAIRGYDIALLRASRWGTPALMQS